MYVHAKIRRDNPSIKNRGLLLMPHLTCLGLKLKSWPTATGKKKRSNKPLEKRNICCATDIIGDGERRKNKRLSLSVGWGSRSLRKPFDHSSRKNEGTKQTSCVGETRLRCDAPVFDYTKPKIKQKTLVDHKWIIRTNCEVNFFVLLLDFIHHISVNTFTHLCNY